MPVDAILIPVKRLDEAKQRLAATLNPQQRRRLGLAMLADVLRATEKWAGRWVVTSDPDAEAVGLAFGCKLVADRSAGLNSALEDATAVAMAGGATTALVLASDVPLVEPGEVASMFACEADVVIASSDDGGTNGLLRRPPNAIPPSFGNGSAAEHARAAAAGNLVIQIADAASLVLDIDEPADLLRLAAAESDRESVRIARELTGA